MNIRENSILPSPQQLDSSQNIGLYTFNINSTVPPTINKSTTAQCTEEIEVLYQMLRDLQTSAIILTGDFDTGKSTLAALLFHRLYEARQAGLPAPQHLIWLNLSIYATLADVIAAILSHMRGYDANFFFLQPEQQMELLFNMLQRESTFVVLDQFETLFDPEAPQGLTGQDTVIRFFEALRINLGASRILLTSSYIPVNVQCVLGNQVRIFPISNLTFAEGLALLQQRGVKGSYEDLSLAWQHCGGRVFTLVLFSALMKLSELPLHSLLHSTECQPQSKNAYALQLITAIYNRLNSTQYTLMRTLCLFSQPVSLQEITTTIIGAQSQLRPPAFEQNIAILVDLSLVQQTTNEQGMPCYALHTLLRQYVLEHYLIGSGQYSDNKSTSSLGVTTQVEMDGAEILHIALAAGHMNVAIYYQSLAKEHRITGGRRASLREIEPIVLAIRHLCLGWQWQQAFDLFAREGLHEFMVGWGKIDTLIALYTNMLPEDELVNTIDGWRAVHVMDTLYIQLGNSQQRLTWYNRALSIQQRNGDLQGAAITYLNRGELFQMLGDQQQAYLNFEQALKLSDNLASPLFECIVLNNLGTIHHTAKEYQQAMSYYRKSLYLAYELQYSVRAGVLLTNIGVLLYEQEQYRDALKVLRYAVQIRQSLHDQSVNAIESFCNILEQSLLAVKPSQPAVHIRQTGQATNSQWKEDQRITGQQSTDEHDAERMQQAALETLKYVALQPAQGRQEQYREVIDPQQRSLLETQLQEVVRPKQSNGKKTTKQTARTVQRHYDSKENIGSNGRLGTTSLWTNNTFG